MPYAYFNGNNVQMGENNLLMLFAHYASFYPIDTIHHSLLCHILPFMVLSH